jgi:hypothetical protein
VLTLEDYLLLEAIDVPLACRLTQARPLDSSAICHQGTFEGAVLRCISKHLDAELHPSKSVLCMAESQKLCQSLSQRSSATENETIVSPSSLSDQSKHVLMGNTVPRPGRCGWWTLNFCKEPHEKDSRMSMI